MLPSPWMNAENLVLAGSRMIHHAHLKCFERLLLGQREPQGLRDFGSRAAYIFCSQCKRQHLGVEYVSKPFVRESDLTADKSLRIVLESLPSGCFLG